MGLAHAKLPKPVAVIFVQYLSLKKGACLFYTYSINCNSCRAMFYHPRPSKAKAAKLCKQSCFCV